MELFSYQDYRDGLCEASQVGSPKDPASAPTEDLDMAALIRAAHVHVGGEATFVEQAKKNPAALFNAMLKMGVAQVAKEASPQLRDIEAYSDEELEAMTSNDLKRLVLKSIGSPPLKD